MLKNLLKLENLLSGALGIFEANIHIGLNDKASAQTRHGVLWVQTDAPGGNKRIMRVPVIIDRPHAVQHGLNKATWQRVKKQVEGMGIRATHIELKFDGAHYTYSLNEYKELYASGDGAPMYVPAIA